MSTVRSTGRAVGKRALAAFICLTMLCGFIPAAVLSTKSADVATYVSLPITIRDYAADGMLFEWNEELQQLALSILLPATAMYVIHLRAQEHT